MKFIVKKECDWATFSAKPGEVLNDPPLPKEVLDYLLAEKAIAPLAPPTTANEPPPQS